MRNDTDDDLDRMPSLSAGRDRDEPYPAPDLETVDTRERTYRERDRERPARSRGGKRGFGAGPLWAMVIALLIALGGLGWWSFQQIALLEMQLVATQESFARISEDAVGRLQDISGQVVATESNVTTESEALKLRIKQLEGQLAEVTRQQRAILTQQESLTGRQSNHDKSLQGQEALLASLSESVKTQRASLADLGESVKALDGQQAALREAQQAQARLASQLEELSGQVAALRRRGDPSSAIDRLEQDLLVLRSQVENRPTPSLNTAEFDSFRAQITRNISTLQSQIANLQGQIDARQ